MSVKSSLGRRLIADNTDKDGVSMVMVKIAKKYIDRKIKDEMNLTKPKKIMRQRGNIQVPITLVEVAYPMEYDEPRSQEFLALISSGASLKLASKTIGVQPGTIMGWMTKHPEFKEMYYLATAERSEVMVDEILEIADDLSMDVQDRRLMTDVRKWIAGKQAPKRFGDKIDVTSGGKVLGGNNVVFRDMSHPKLEEVEVIDAEVE